MAQSPPPPPPPPPPSAGPTITPWPDTFAGEPLPSNLASLLRRSLDWNEFASLRLWARMVAYHVTGLRPGSPPAVEALARERLAQLLDVARAGLGRPRRA